MKRITQFLSMLVLLSCDPAQQPIKEEQTAFSDPPQWSKEVVWYQIFVERFRNGDPTNDPTPFDMEGTYPGFIPQDWELTPWTQDWYRPDPYFKSTEGRRDFGGNPITDYGQKLQLRRYGGDLQGVLDQMDYIDSLGVSAIYFNPVNDAPSLHKYDARYWRHVDRNFGPNPKGDIRIMQSEDHLDPSTWQLTSADQLFLQVVEEFHKRDIRVIMDFSWNHTGKSFWAWKDLEENQAESAYRNWYWVEQFDDPKTDEDEFEYRGWLGISSLPEIKETVEMDHSKALEAMEGDVYLDEVKEHIFAVTRRWLDPNGDGDPSDGVDGFRLDVAAEMPLGFWRDYRKVVREVNPDAYLVGEVWWKKWPDDLMDPVDFLQGDVFDAQMNYRWYRAVRHFFNASPEPITVSELVDSLNAFRSNLNPQNVYAMMNLGASHDAPRVLTSLFNKNQYKVGTNPYTDNNYKIHKPGKATYQTLSMLLVQQYTYIGSPHVWAGDEMGMWGSDDPHTRKPLIWPDYQFEDEAGSMYGFERPVDKVAFDTTLFAFYQKLIRMRDDFPVLKTGDIEFNLVDDEKQLLGYRRYDDKASIQVIFNASHETQEVRIDDIQGSGYDLISGTQFNNATLEIAPRSSLVLVPVNE